MCLQRKINAKFMQVLISFMLSLKSICEVEESLLNRETLLDEDLHGTAVTCAALHPTCSCYLQICLLVFKQEKENKKKRKKW